MPKNRRTTVMPRDRKTVAFFAFMAVTIIAAVGMYWADTTRSSDTGYVSSYTPNAAVVPGGPRLSIPDDPRVLFIGDSFTQGVGASTETLGYAYLAGQKLGWDFRVDGKGGTGYTWPGPTGEDLIYSTRISAHSTNQAWRPNVIVLQGGLNDYRATPQELQTAAERDIDALRAAFPGVQIVMFGPVAADSKNAATVNLSTPLASSALVKGVPFISPIAEHWITPDNTAEMIGSDHYHPTDAGHSYLAYRLVERINELSESSAS